MNEVRREQTGEALWKDCHNEVRSNTGCGVKGPISSYGKEFNKGDGGVSMTFSENVYSGDADAVSR